MQNIPLISKEIDARRVLLMLDSLALMQLIDIDIYVQVTEDLIDSLNEG